MTTELTDNDFDRSFHCPPTRSYDQVFFAPAGKLAWCGMPDEGWYITGDPDDPEPVGPFATEAEAMAHASPDPRLGRAFFQPSEF